MKRSLAVTLGALLVVAVAGIANAMDEEVVTVNIPFQFTVNEKVLPAGKYEISYTDLTEENLMRIRDLEKLGEETNFVVEDLAAPKAPDKSELVFDEIGNQHFLRQIWIEGQDEGHQLAETKAEKALMDKGSTKAPKRVPAEHAKHKAMK